MAYFPDRDQSFDGIKPVWHLEPDKKDVMGYRLADADAVNGRVIYPGTPIKTDEKAKTAVLCKYAHVEAVSNDKKKVTVEPYHYLKAGDTVAISGEITLIALIIATVEDEGRTLTFASAISSKSAEDLKDIVLVEVETKEGVVAPKNIPNRIVNAKATMDSLHKTVSAAHAGVVVENFVFYPKEYLNETTFPGSMLLAGCPSLMFIYQ